MKLLTIVILLAVGAGANADTINNNPIEAGHVRWGRDFDAALAGENS